MRNYDNIFRILIVGLVLILYLSIFREAVINVFRGIYLVGVFITLLILFKGKFSHITGLYLFFLPMGPILPINSVLIQGVDLIEVISLLLIIQYFLIYKKITLKNLSKNQRLAVTFLFFYFIIYLSTFFTKVFYEYNPNINLTKLIIRISKNILHFTCLTMIITKLNIPSVKNTVKKSIIIIIVFYSIAVFFSYYFYKAGLQIYYLENRKVGLFNGNSNMYGHFLSILFGYLIYVYEKEKKILYIILSLLPFVAILITASRTGLFTTILITIVYLFKNMNITRIIKFIILTILGIYIFINFGSNIVKRMQELPKQIKDPTYNRNKYQTLYLKEIKRNPEIIFFGLLERASFGRYRIPHNMFFSVLIWGGIFYLIFFIRILYKIYILNIHKNKSYSSLFIYPFMGFLLPILFYPGNVVGIFPLILAINEDKLDIQRKFLQNLSKNQKMEAI